MAAPSKSSRRQWFVPQFSLRALLTVVTLSAIGTAVWYRWPIEERIDLYANSTPQNRAAAVSSPHVATREVRTVRRVWGGGRIRHGLTRQYNGRGKLLSETMWQEDRKHGPAREWRDDGTLWFEGAYFSDANDGVWKVSNRWSSQIGGTSEQTWERGKPCGVWKLRDSSGLVSRTIEFQQGAAVRINGKEVDDPLMMKRWAGKIEDKGIQKALEEDTELDFVETALKDVVTYLRDVHGVPIELNWRSMEEQGISIDHPVTESLRGASLSVALVVMLEPLGLVADYRFGVIMITPAVDAKNWRDRTGVSEVKPRPGSALARQWERPAEFDFVETGLTDVMRYLSSETGVPFEVAIEKPFDQTPITRNLRNESLKDSLGILCEGANLHVRQDGDTLVIELLETPTAESANP